MAKKPSFFERLTGATWTEENKKSTEKSKTSSRTQTKEKTKPIQKDYSTDKKTKEVPLTQETKEWPTESEGQLTIDVYQTSSEIVIKSTIAGVKPEDIDISITNDMVTIKGTREKDEEVQAEDYYYQECYWGPFARSVILPVDVEADRAEASMKNGILTIRLPKVEKVKTKKIEVKIE
jgi:HSP20 family protein